MAATADKLFDTFGVDPEIVAKNLLKNHKTKMTPEEVRILNNMCKKIESFRLDLKLAIFELGLKYQSSEDSF